MAGLDDCILCPRMCHADRTEGGTGVCGAGEKARVALVSLHQWEEPCISGERGAGTVFFSHCSLKCVFCQNHEISHGGKGRDVSPGRLAEIFIEQQARGAETLDLVTPTQYAPQILQALIIAKRHGLTIPVVWNSGGYETESMIESMRGYVDVFMPDLKYRDEGISKKYSGASNYFIAASKAIIKMYNMTGSPKYDVRGIMRRGLLVRHMVLPGCRKDSMRLLDWLWKNFKNNIKLSLMNQYTPMYKAYKYHEIDRKLTTFEYDSVVNYAYDLGFRNAYIQEGSAATEAFVPDFNLSGV